MLDRTVSCILVILFLSNSIYGLASAFLPTLASDLGIASSWTGLIFATYSIAMTIVSFIVGNIVDRVGHSVIIAAGAQLMAYSTAAFGLLVYIDKDHNWLVILSAIILRFLQGTGCGMISTAAYSFAG